MESYRIPAARDPEDLPLQADRNPELLLCQADRDLELLPLQEISKTSVQALQGRHVRPSRVPAAFRSCRGQCSRILHTQNPPVPLHQNLNLKLLNPQIPQSQLSLPPALPL